MAGAGVVLEYGHDKPSHASFMSEFRTSASELGHPLGASLIVDVVHGNLFEDNLLCAYVRSVRYASLDSWSVKGRYNQD